ncbi:MAG TPA: RNA polymerase sigma factor [Candidatus Paceibacterota bacterium]|jgi:RNA polymerase sigma-70 factor (ECF subfamily)
MTYSKEVWEGIPDEEVLRIARQDPDAFEALIDRYEAPFLRKARSILWSPEDAEEVVQDAFTRIYLYADRFIPQEGASFSSWGYAILIRLCYTRYGKLRRDKERREDLEPEAYERLPDQGNFLEDLTVRNEVLAVLAKLPETAARVLRLQFIEGKSQEEIAAIEGSSVPAVKTRVHRAKKLFQTIYDRNR